jgi:signal transduction histidine kinase
MKVELARGMGPFPLHRWLKGFWLAVAALAAAGLLLSLYGYWAALRAALQAAGPILAAVELIGVLASLLAALVSLGLAGLLYWRRADDFMALYVSFLLLAYGIIMAGPLEHLSVFFAPLADVAITLQAVVMAAPLVFLLLLFPNGRFVPAWTRWLVPVVVGWSLVLLTVPPYNQWESATVPQLTALLALYLILPAIGFAAQIHRYRRVSDPAQRQQIKWVVYGFALWLAFVAVSSVPYFVLTSAPPEAPLPAWAPLSSTFWWLSLNIVPLSLTVAVLRYRLWDLHLVVNRTLVYGALTVTVISVYVLVVGALSLVFRQQGSLLISMVATGLVAVLFQPLRERLQQAANQLLYGERNDPVAVMRELGQQLEATLAADAVLPTFVQTVARSLRLPYVAITVQGEGKPEVAAEYGRPTAETVSYPLVYQGSSLGQLIVAPRGRGEAFTPAEDRLLADIARHAGPALHAVGLTAALQRSRRRLVTAREEERRRLQHDLHDGLGPTLAAHMLKVGAARAAAQDNPEAAEALLAELEDDLEATLDVVRRVVHNLRPPELDHLGLPGAVTASAARYDSLRRAGAGEALAVEVDLPERLPQLPAAVEVAVYLIVQESLANVTRHARATRCRVSLSCGDELRLRICDNGRGLPAGYRAGVGLASMRERVAELGGRWSVGPGPDGGVCVVATIPIGV